MKELSIREKAKRYDKISKEVKDFFEGKQKMYSDVEQTLNHLFPELKESKDEQIRKVLVEWFKRYKERDTCGSEMFNGIPTDNILAWLEKQGSEPNWYHHKVDLSDCSEEYRKAYYDGWNNCNMQHSQYKSESNDVVKCLINGMKFYYEDNEEATWGTEKFSMKVKDILSWLEKQGEQKETLCEKCKKAQPSHSCQDITALGRCAVEHEQKTADDVEPKFHKGEWITNGDYTWKIVEVKPLDYILQSQDGNIVDDTISHVDEHFHSFTIEDAKDGDVLCCENGWTCIFKTLVKDETFSSYCFMDSTKWFCETGSECHTLNKEFMKAYNGEIKPATKEQRDALERAITNAGYRWDKEKFKLEKI